MPKFFAYPHSIASDTIHLTGCDASHIARVLRAQPGDSLVVCDGDGTDYVCAITCVSPEEVVLKIQDAQPADTEPNLRITLFQALPKADKMDLIIQKCVELGVHEIVPVITDRCVVRLNEKSERKLARYNKIAETAAKQSMRGIVPKVRDFLRLPEAIHCAQGLDQRIVPYENETQNRIKDLIRQGPGSIGVFIGPEGGFSNEEMDLFAANHVQPVTLGKRILRTETAGFTTLIILLYETEEL